MFIGKRIGTPREGAQIHARTGLLLLVVLLPLAMFLAGCSQQKSTPVAQPLTNPTALNSVVWAKKLTGIYYCHESATFGTGPGAYMKQEKALDSGYQPEFGTYCGEPNAPKSADQTKSGGIASFFTR